MKPVHWILLGAFGPLCFFLFVSGLDTACTLDEIKAAGETHIVCYREWIGALSGWIAALAAGVTIFVLLQQIRKQEEIANRVADESNALFLKEINRLLNEMNFIWKHAEDIHTELLAGNDMNRAIAQLRHQLSVAEKFPMRERLEEWMANMHPRQRDRALLFLTQYSGATQGVKIPRYDEDTDDITYVEADNEDYIDGVIFDFSNFYHMTKDEFVQVKDIFKNRRTLDLDDEILYGFAPKGLGSAFLPNDPNNPY